MRSGEVSMMFNIAYWHFVRVETIVFYVIIHLGISSFKRVEVSE